MSQTTHADVWRNFQHGLHDTEGSSLRCRGNRLSYNSVPIAVRDDFGAEIAFLINGDLLSIGTGRGGKNPQWEAIEKLKPNVQVPFSALAGAKLTNGGWNSWPLDGLEIIDNRPDEQWYECPVCHKKVVQKYYDGNWSYFHVLSMYQREKIDYTNPICKNSNGDVANAEYHHTLGAVVLRYQKRHFLSGIDDQENRRNYFLVELPHRVKAVDEAYTSLKPKEVIEAEKAGTEVLRQGEVFCIKTDRQFSKDQIRHIKFGHVQILGIRHYATDVVEIKNRKGRVVKTYARGMLRHATTGNAPSWGRGGPEHKQVKLDGWYRLVKNTALGSWQSSGRVD